MSVNTPTTTSTTSGVQTPQTKKTKNKAQAFFVNSLINGILVKHSILIGSAHSRQATLCSPIKSRITTFSFAKVRKKDE